MVKDAEMQVLGERGTIYSLVQSNVGAEYDGKKYRVKGKDNVMVKIFVPAMQTDAQKNKVLIAANGGGGMLGPRPIEPVYERGRFAGYAFEVESPQPIPKPPQGDHYLLFAGFSAGLGIIFSLVLHFVLIGILTRDAAELNKEMLCGGGIMIAAGWILGAVVFYKGMSVGWEEYACMLAAAGCFIAACAIVYFATGVVATIFAGVVVGASLLMQILPDVLAFAIVGGILWKAFRH